MNYGKIVNDVSKKIGKVNSYCHNICQKFVFIHHRQYKLRANAFVFVVFSELLPCSSAFIPEARVGFPGVYLSGHRLYSAHAVYALLYKL